jgi:hypothetical protein
MVLVTGGTALPSSFKGTLRSCAVKRSETAPMSAVGGKADLADAGVELPKIDPRRTLASCARNYAGMDALRSRAV